MEIVSPACRTEGQGKVRVWETGRSHFHRMVVPEPYQAGEPGNTFGSIFGGHEPGACCNTRTCEWMHEGAPGHESFGPNPKLREVR
jgi:hypothetical protein